MMRFRALVIGAVLLFNAPALWAADGDADGVDDAYDVCAQTPEGAEVDTYGCAKDADMDGVIDLYDRCESTPFDVMVDAQGCPLPHKESSNENR